MLSFSRAVIIVVILGVKVIFLCMCVCVCVCVCLCVWPSVLCLQLKFGLSVVLCTNISLLPLPATVELVFVSSFTVNQLISLRVDRQPITNIIDFLSRSYWHDKLWNYNENRLNFNFKYLQRTLSYPCIFSSEMNCNLKWSACNVNIFDGA